MRKRSPIGVALLVGVVVLLALLFQRRGQFLFYGISLIRTPVLARLFICSVPGCTRWRWWRARRLLARRLALSVAIDVVPSLLFPLLVLWRARRAGGFILLRVSLILITWTITLVKRRRMVVIPTRFRIVPVVLTRMKSRTIRGRLGTRFALKFLIAPPLVLRRTPIVLRVQNVLQFSG